jgi:phenylpyruvate tautomerase PptA (4-oxalocrotonate tautomerase family)
MPLLDLTFQEGTLSEDAKRDLPGKMAEALLRAERAPDTEFFRKIAWTHVHELPAGSQHTADGPATEPQVIVQATTPQGALSDRRREELVRDVTDLILDATGWGDEDRLRIWVMCREIDEGSWGAGGGVIRFEQLKEAAKAEREGGGEKAAAKEAAPA